MCTLDKCQATLMTFLNTHKVNSMLDYDTLDIGTLDITASPKKPSTFLNNLNSHLIYVNPFSSRLSDCKLR